MARKFFLLVSVTGLVVGLMAIVRAQDGAWRSTDRTSREPAILTVSGEENALPPSSSVLKRSSRAAGVADRLQSIRRTSQPAAKVEGVDVSIGDGPSDPPAEVSNARESTSSLPSVLKRKTKSASDTAAGTIAARPPTGSSRRSPPASKSAPEVPPTEFSPAAEGHAHLSPPGPATDDSLLLSVGPQIQVATSGPRAALRGKPAAYVVSLMNQGDVTAQDVHVRIALPAWVEIAGNEATAGTARMQEDGNGSARLVWVVDQLEPRTQLQLNLQLVPTEHRPIEMNVDWIFRPVSATAQIEVQQPQLEMTLAGAKEALYGEGLTYVLTISNPGSGEAENVQVKLVAGQNAPEVISVGQLPAGQQKQIELQLTANQVGAMKIHAEASAEGELRAEIAEEVQVRRAELQVTVTGPESTFAGTESTYQVHVQNTGNAAADEVAATILLPAGAKLVSTTEGAKVAANGVQWRVGSLAPETERVFEVRCELMTAGDNRLDARVQANGLSAANSFTTQVQSSVELNLTLNEPKGPRAVGEIVVYEIQLANRGTKVAEDVQVVVQFSDGIEPVGAEGGKSDLVPGQVVFQPLAKIGAGEQVILRVKARADRDGNHIVRTEIKCGDIQDSIQKTKKFFQPGGNSSPAPGTSARPSTAGRR